LHVSTRTIRVGGRTIALSAHRSCFDASDPPAASAPLRFYDRSAAIRWLRAIAADPAGRSALTRMAYEALGRRVGPIGSVDDWIGALAECFERGTLVATPIALSALGARGLELAVDEGAPSSALGPAESAQTLWQGRLRTAEAPRWRATTTFEPAPRWSGGLKVSPPPRWGGRITVQPT
jgi:hypothetical protein